MKRSRLLIVNADDFGFTRDVNRGIVDAHRHGILTAATLMANGAAFDDAVGLARQTPALDIGCHLVLTGGRSVANPSRELPATVPALAAAIAARRLSIEGELAAQIRRVLDAGLQPTHLDTHKHTHLLPPVLDAVAALAGEFGIRWVRRPFDFPRTGGGMPLWMRAAAIGIRVLQRRFERILARHDCRATDHFAGFQMTGRFRTRQLADLIRNLPDGLTEFMCHPGFATAELLAARTRLKGSRQRELEALTSPETRRAVEDAGVRLVSYRDLGN